jgi:uncharacterized membrane protein
MIGVEILDFATLGITGLVSCAEFGSYAFVHPVIRQLPASQHIQVEQGFLRTFGRVMPIGMTLCLVLTILHASIGGGHGGSSAWRWLAAASFGAALVSTIVFNVPINLATGRWDANNPPTDWQLTRNRWETFQGLRSWLLIIGFVFTSVGFAFG